jgi:hypothetical protein
MASAFNSCGARYFFARIVPDRTFTPTAILTASLLDDHLLDCMLSRKQGREFGFSMKTQMTATIGWGPLG